MHSRSGPFQELGQVAACSLLHVAAPILPQSLSLEILQFCDLPLLSTAITQQPSWTLDVRKKEPSPESR